MRKSDFIRLVSDRSGVTQREVKVVVNVMCDALMEIFEREDSVKFGDICTFKGITRPRKKARNPHTGEEVIIEERHGCPKCIFSERAKGKTLW